MDKGHSRKNYFPFLLKPYELASFLKQISKLMKKLLFFVLALVFSMAAASAQNLKKARTPKSPDEKSEKFTQRLIKELNLDAAQQERVKGINLERFKQIEEVKAASLSSADRREKMKTIEEVFVSSMKGVLSETQFAGFQALRTEIKEKAFGRRNKQQ